MTDHQQKLRLYKTAYTQLQHSFKNNLKVIRQLQVENTQLQKHCGKYETQLQKILIQKQEKHRKQLQQQEIGYGREVQLMKKQYESYIQSLSENEQKKNHQQIMNLTKKHRQQLQNLRTHMNKQIQSKQLSIKKSQSRSKSLEQSLTSTQSKLNSLNVKFITIESQLQRLQKQRKQTQALYSSKQQQLESIKQYSTSWETTLKQRIKELEDQKSLLEQDMAQIRFSQRQKLKKMKDQHTKKLTSLQETHTQRLNQTLLHSKEIKFKYESIKQSNTQLKTQAQYTKRQLLQTRKLLEEQRLRYTSAQDSILTVKQKQFQIKSMAQEIRRLQNQIKTLQDDKNTQKQECQKINYQRENAQKALERLKTQLLNKNKQCDDYKKQMDKIKYKIKVNYYQPQTLQQISGKARELARYEQKDAIKGGQNDYSKCFSDDMGGEDFKFLNSHVQSSPQKLPYGQQQQLQQSVHQQLPDYQQNMTKISHLMKRVGQLQVQNQQYASTIKLIKEEMERTASTINDRLNLKDQQIRLGKNENMLLRQKLNDKQEQLMRVKDSVRQLKQQLQRSSTSKQSIQQLNTLKQQKQKLAQQNKRLFTQVQTLKQEISDITKQRETLQEIADELRAEVNLYKDQLSYYYYQQDKASNFTSSHVKEQQILKNHHKNISVVNDNDRDYLNNASNQYSQFSQQTSNKFANEQSTANYHNAKNTKPAKNQRIAPNHQPSSQNPSNLQQPSQYRPHSRSKSPLKHNKHQQPSSTKGPKRKLHQLIKQKNQLQAQGTFVIGRKANLQKKLQEERTEHVGTKSQKQIYERMQKRSKSKSRQKPIINRFKDYEVPKPERESSMRPEYNRKSQRQQINDYQPDNSSKNEVSQLSQQVSQDIIEHSALMKRIQMMNRMKQSMGNDSLGEFEHLENVSMTYWDQQEHY